MDIANVAGRFDRIAGLRLMLAGQLDDDDVAEMFVDESTQMRYFDVEQSGKARPSAFDNTPQRALEKAAQAERDLQNAAVVAFTSEYSTASNSVKDQIAEKFLDGPGLPRLGSKNSRVRSMHADIKKRMGKIEDRREREYFGESGGSSDLSLEDLLAL